MEAELQAAHFVRDLGIKQISNKMLRVLLSQLDDTEVGCACKAETAKNRGFFVIF
jgi:hypothetical protein